jgi:uncharacterized protein YfdQ (DUF2303 family)
MFTSEAIQRLAEAESLTAANTAIREAMLSEVPAALPTDFQLRDLEQFTANRRRARGTMDTASIKDFAAYVAQHHEEGAAVFVSHKAMVANAVLNLGTPSNPGHADNRAQFKPRETAAYLALHQVAGGNALPQTQVAEFLEDWAHMVTCFHEAESLAINKAIAAVRNITIEGLRKVEASEQQLSASKSAFESVTASSKETLPTYIYFKCVPYHEFEERTFVMRLGIRTSDKPAITLRIVAREQHDEDMAAELRSKVDEAITSGMPVLVGEYTAKS